MFMFCTFVNINPVVTTIFHNRVIVNDVVEEMSEDKAVSFEMMSAVAMMPPVEPVLPQTVKALLGRDGLLLLMMKQNGMWDLPGGKVDGNEALDIALQREVEEETGLGVHGVTRFSQGLRHREPRVPVLVTFYDVRIVEPWTTGDVRLSSEHRDLVMADAALVQRLPMPDVYRQMGLNWLTRAA
jgi:8-oxo-dGTP pyrophosphatase MutT (NUDIX family)